LLLYNLDEKDEEIADALIFLGMSRPIARTLSYLQHVDEATSVELEMGTGLRQPEVSIAMKELMERKWINEREEKKQGKGRPYKIYSLKIGFNEIIAHLEKQQKKAVDEAQEKIEQLKELGRLKLPTVSKTLL
jgi:predicted transcriptional regulator